MSDVDRLSTPADLQEDLSALLERAHENGVDVRGGWECPNGEDPPAWDVVVTAVDADWAAD